MTSKTNDYNRKIDVIFVDKVFDTEIYRYIWMDWNML